MPPHHRHMHCNGLSLQFPGPYFVRPRQRIYNEGNTPAPRRVTTFRRAGLLFELEQGSTMHLVPDMVTELVTGELIG